MSSPLTGAAADPKFDNTVCVSNLGSEHSLTPWYSLAVSTLHHGELDERFAFTLLSCLRSSVSMWYVRLVRYCIVLA